MSESTFGRGGLSHAPRRRATRAAISQRVAKAIVYSTEPCSFCQRVKALLRAHGVEFDEINLSKDPVGRVELARRTGMMSFPQVLVGERVIGGYADVQRAADSGELDELRTS